MFEANNERGFERMLKVPQQQYIRFLREIEGANITNIAETMGVDWRTAKKYADKDDWNQPTIRKQHKMPVIDPYKEIIDIILQEDNLLPRKQRHTAVKIYQTLIEQYGFKGSIRTVSSYVSKRKSEMQLDKAVIYQRLDHPEAEAQADFTTIQVSHEGSLLEYKLLVLSFPFSNAAFVHPVPSENQECFLEGLKILFEKAGGVPERIWFDNLSAAVISIKPDGKRQLTDAFMRFSSHYRFESIFCNPNSGNEKGNVENKCGYSKHNWCVPIPIFESQEKLAEQLDAEALADMDRPHYTKGTRIQDLWMQEQPKLRKLPTTDFSVYRLESAKVNAYGEVKIDKINAPLFQVKPESTVILRFWWERVDVLDEFHRLLTTFPRAYTGKKTEIPWQEAFRNYIHKPRSINHAHLVKMLPDRLRAYIKIEDISVRKERLQAVYHWCSNYTVNEIEQVLSYLGDEPPVELITARLALLKPLSSPYKDTLNEPYTPPEVRKLTMNLARYDLLAKGGETI